MPGTLFYTWSRIYSVEPGSYTDNTVVGPTWVPTSKPFNNGNST